MATSIQPLPGPLRVGTGQVSRFAVFGALGVAAFAVILYTIIGVVLALLYSAGAWSSWETLLPR